MSKMILKETFYVLTGSLAVFVVLETVWPGMVLAYININWVLLFWFLNVILILLNTNKNKSV